MLISTENIQIRDPFVVTVPEEGRYYLFGSTDANIWGPGTGFDMYVGESLERWQGPFPVFRPEPEFFAERNFWAPEVHLYRGRYYMLATFRRSHNSLLGTAVLAAECLEGPYLLHSNGPVTPESWCCLDGTLYVDGEGLPWMVFCREWQQVTDGQICAVRLTEDLQAAAGEPVVLFRASQAGWPSPFHSERYPGQNNYVTDGPFLYHAAGGALLMLWASFIDNTYALGVSSSASGSVLGPWEHEEEALFRSDGGHGMLFRTLDGRLMLTVHSPNKTPHERPCFLEVEERDGWLRVVEGRPPVGRIGVKE